MPARDPRSYISVTPLPIGPQKGLKIQARSIDVYNPTDPSRDEVRKLNFARRSAQLSGQGFQSANHKPYHGIGDPFYLDEKKLILHALGQWDATQDWDMTSSSEDEDSFAETSNAQRGNMTAAKFVLRRTRKDLNTLGKEVVKGRQMIRNVRLGYGLFDLIRQERMAKRTAAFLEKQRKQEALRSTWQPPKGDSESEEESDDDIMQEDNDDRYSSGETSGSTASRKKKSKKKHYMPRPYTPQHTGLCELADKEDANDRHGLFRQLCALNWVLDAMNLEQGYHMSPITTCWSHKEIGGMKKEKKSPETKWESFLRSSMPGKIGKKVSTVRGVGRTFRQSIVIFNPRTSIQSASPSPSSSSSAVNIPTMVSSLATAVRDSAAMCKEETIPEEPKVAAPVHSVSLPTTSEAEEDALDAPYSKSMFKFLDEYYESLRREKMEDDTQAPANSTAPATPGPKDKSQHPERKVKKARKKSKERDKTPDRIALHDLQEALGIPRGMRAAKFVKPKPSAELEEFLEKKPSNKYLTLSVDLANKFKEVQDDKAMTLHDILEQMERERLAKCQNKYVCMPTKLSSVHRALKAMREEGDQLMQKPSVDAMRRKSLVKGNWYSELYQAIPEEVRVLWYYQVILNKLRKYGLVESTSKQSVYKFLKVLAGLREWEICSPDISAAIEFCRESIVDLSVEEYEEWFRSVFPRVTRPQTAPPTLKGDKGGKSKKGDKKEGTTSMTSSSSGVNGQTAVRQVHSAFARRAQT